MDGCQKEAYVFKYFSRVLQYLQLIYWYVTNDNDQEITYVWE